jgi:hypothetical protein
MVDLQDPGAFIFRVKMEVTRSSKMVASYHIIIWNYNSKDHNSNLND